MRVVIEKRRFVQYSAGCLLSLFLSKVSASEMRWTGNSVQKILAVEGEVGERVYPYVSLGTKESH